jgi:hypothetical protein
VRVLLALASFYLAKPTAQHTIFRRKTQHNTTINSFTNTKALSSGSWGWSGFTAILRLAVPLGIDVAVERPDML